MKTNKSKFSKHGFTLMEILVVIAIIGILASIVFPNIQNARARARNTKRMIEVDQLANAIALYEQDNEGTPPGEDGIEYVNCSPEWIPGLVPKYIEKVPCDPLNKEPYKFHYTRQGKDFAVVSLLEKNISNAEDIENISCGENGSSCQYYKKGTGTPLEILNPGTDGWSFSSTTKSVTISSTLLTCGTPGQPVTICHKASASVELGETITVACTATGPEGHNNHTYDTLGACLTEDVSTTTPTIQASAEIGGSISPSGSVSVNTGDDATFTIIPNSGFAIWSVAVDGVDQGALETYTFSNVEMTHAIHATFKATTPSYHSFSITSGPNGKITSPSTSVTRGGDITFTITPDEGYEVASFSIDGKNAGIPSTYTFTNVTSDHAINAMFNQKVVTPQNLDDLRYTEGLFTLLLVNPYQMSKFKT
jgi:type II secretion system protein G